MSKELNPKQAKFLSEYLKDFNATRAAKDAGYSEKTAYSISYELLKKPEIKNAVLKEFEKHGSVMQRVLAEYFKIATADIKDYLIVEPGGAIEPIPFEDIEEGKTSVIKKIREKRLIKQLKGNKNQPTTDILLDQTIEYELHDKEKALDAICKIAGMFQTNIDLTSGGEKIPQAQFVVYKKGDE